MRLQAEIAAPLTDIECSAPNDSIVIAYIQFAWNRWETIGFAIPHPYDREQCEEAFITALAYDSRGATIH